MWRVKIQLGLPTNYNYKIQCLPYAWNITTCHMISQLKQNFLIPSLLHFYCAKEGFNI